MMKKLLLFVSILLVCLNLSSFAQSVPLYTQEAENLQELGLFTGTNNGFELERAPKKVEAAVMLVRLLGKEGVAKSGSYKHPFKDVPGWADAYIGYMYENGLTTGISTTEFGSEQDTNTQTYVTFILRALGYDDKKGDFTWSTAIDASLEKGLLTGEELAGLNAGKFLRDDMVHISYTALNTPLNSDQRTLADKLIDENVIMAETCSKLGINAKSLESKYFVTYKVEKKDNKLVYNLSVDQVPEEFKDDFSALSGLGGSGVLPPFTEKQYYIMLEPRYDWPQKFASLKSGASNGYNIDSFYDKQGDIIGFVDFSYITEPGTYIREFHVWDKEKEKRYYDEYNKYLDNMMAGAKSIEQYLQYYIVDNDVHIFVDLDSAFGSVDGDVYYTTGTGNESDPYAFAVRNLQKYYLQTDEPHGMYNDVKGIVEPTDKLSSYCKLLLLDDSKVLGYVTIPENPPQSSENLYNVTLRKTVPVEEDMETVEYKSFNNIDMGIYIDNVLEYRIVGNNLCDTQGNVLAEYLRQRLTVNEGDDEFEYLFSIRMLKLEGGNVQFKFLSDSAGYELSW